MDLKLLHILMEPNNAAVYNSIVSTLVCQYPDLSTEELKPIIAERFRVAMEVMTSMGVENPVIITVSPEEMQQTITTMLNHVANSTFEMTPVIESSIKVMTDGINRITEKVSEAAEQWVAVRNKPKLMN